MNEKVLFTSKCYTWFAVNPSPYITHGNEATPHQFPWQVGLIMTLETGQQAFCGGSLISDEWVLTAGHCAKSVRSFQVILGAHKVKEDEPSQLRMTSAEAIVHEKYSSLLIHNDIALVKLPQKVNFTESIRPIRLPSRSDAGNTFSGYTGTVSGWGKDSDSATGISPVLRYESDQIISNLKCRLQYLVVLKATNICMDGGDGRSTCNGDSGGPMYVDGEDGAPIQVGIVSFGSRMGCEKGFHPVFTRAIDWSQVHPLDYYYGVRSSGSRITNGNEATPHQFPWQAAVILTMATGQQAFCGGSVISDEWILTAAHCAKDAESFEIILGAQKVQENEPTQIRITTTNKIVHEENIQAIRLPSLSEQGNNFKGQTATVSGWGKPSDDATSISPVLRFESDKVIGNLICRLQYLINLRDSNVCLDGSDGRSTCNGDSGGPLYIQDKDGKPTQIGVVSFGSALGCEKGYHPVFTRVTSYLKWISQKTGIALRP
ncbi:hypothetical protein J437_LFUL014045 [Ladona fulva]|uniref:Peptidase S1 domain-containing protein n=1 Tax=Ladona fulva TaxID=123851 RepID=A0A8K0P6K2_LADFU|nr:hypothetical protein J437_LFUL014045 [Ladona fulva]